MATILFNRGLVLAELETIFNVPETPMASTDSILVSEPDFSVDVTTIDRTNLKSSISQDPVVVARKVAGLTFAHEVRGSGDATGATAPQVGDCIQACGFSETQITAGTATIISDIPHPVNSPAGSFTFAKTTGFTGTRPRIITLECTMAGASGVAEFTVSSPAVGDQAATSLTTQVMTDAMAFDLEDEMTPSQITPTVGAVDFDAGDTFVIWVVPVGYLYQPVSSLFKSLTIYTYYDGLLHEMTGARGTFTVEGAAGGFANFNFDFTGSYVAAVDASIPAGAVFESTLPNQVELADLQVVGGIDGPSPSICAQSFTIDIGNSVNVKECINAPDSIEGAEITDRVPVGGFNPEALVEATHPFWANLAAGERVVLGVRVGKTQGNVVSFFMPFAQYSEIAYGNRNDIRIYDVSLNFAAETAAGNDEMYIHFS